MSHRLLTWSLWGLTTAAATTVSFAGVSVVTPTITASHAPALRGKTVVALAAPAPPAPQGVPPAGAVAPAAPPAAPGAPSLTVLPRGSAPAPAGAPARVPSVAGGAPAASSPLPAPSPAPAPAGNVAPPPAPPVIAPPSAPAPAPPPAAPPPVASPLPAPPPAPPPASPPPPPAPGPVSAAFAGKGGTLTVSCQGATISLLSASPADGYTLTVHSSGPTSVSVTFAAGTDDIWMHATCRNGQPVESSDD